MDLNLAGRVAMVAGASRGLGFAVARALAREGALVSMASRSREAIEAAAARVGADAFGMAADVASPEAIERWTAATAARFGGVDLLFTNSGGPQAGATLSFSDEDWQRATDLLLFSAIRMIRAAVPLMQARGGGAILVSTSASVKEPIPGLGLSTVLRASVSALSKTLAIELAPANIRVNQIVPGRIETDRLRELDAHNARQAGVPVDDIRRRALEAIPMGRYGDADEFGRVAAFLLSDGARYMTGGTIQVDGGLLRSVL